MLPDFDCFTQWCFIRKNMLLQRPDSRLCFGNDIIISQGVDTSGYIQQPSARIKAFACFNSILSDRVIMSAHCAYQFFSARRGKNPRFVSINRRAVLSKFKQRENVRFISVSYPLPARSPIDQSLKGSAADFVQIGNNALKRAVIRVIRLCYKHILPEHQQFFCLTFGNRSVNQRNKINIAPSLPKIIQYHTSV